MAADGRGPDKGSDVVCLEDSELSVSLDRASGALVGLESKVLGWAVHRRPELGVAFRAHVPLPGRRDNFITGQGSPPPTVYAGVDRVEFYWEDLRSEHGGLLPIRLKTIATLREGAVSFVWSVDNGSSLVVETMQYPYIGDLAPRRPGGPLLRYHMRYAQLEPHELSPHFGDLWGYWGVRSPRQTADSSQSLFCLVQGEDAGLYVQVEDPKLSYLVQYTFEQLPGALESVHHNVPGTEVISGTPVHLELKMTHFAFVPPQGSFSGAPVELRAYAGDWAAGVDLYKQWRRTWFIPSVVPAWAKDVHSWQQVQLNNPEDELRASYGDLVAIGAECTRHGVAAIQVVGWNRGGQDRGNPSHATDPRLGDRTELRQAIDTIQAMGVKVILFAKLVWADKTTEWYRDQLRDYVVTDPYGEPYENPGYGYHTPTHLAGINDRRFAVMCPACAAWREVAVAEIQAISDLGASGILYDEVCHHGPALYCFAAEHGHPVPAFVYAGDLPLAAALTEDAHPQEDFLCAGEAPQDALWQSYPFSYFRIHPKSEPVCRYIDPAAPLMVTVTGFDDREGINRALMYRYVISYEPYNFKGSLADFPLTLEYGKKVDSLRRRYRKWLWDGEYRHHGGVRVEVNGKDYPLYAVFQADDRSRAVVIVNEERSHSTRATVVLGHGEPLSLVRPEEPDTVPCSSTVDVPGRSAAIVIEASPSPG